MKMEFFPLLKKKFISFGLITSFVYCLTESLVLTSAELLKYFYSLSHEDCSGFNEY